MKKFNKVYSTLENVSAKKHLSDQYFVQNDVVCEWEKRLSYTQDDLIIKTASGGWKYLYDLEREVDLNKDYAYLFQTMTDNTYGKEDKG